MGLKMGTMYTRTRWRKAQKADNLRLSLQSKGSVNTSIGAKEVKEGKKLLKACDKRNCSGSRHNRAIAGLAWKWGIVSAVALMLGYFLAQLLDNGML